MATSPEAFNQVRDILKKLDRSIDSARDRRLTEGGVESDDLDRGGRAQGGSGTGHGSTESASRGTASTTGRPGDGGAPGRPAGDQENPGKARPLRARPLSPRPFDPSERWSSQGQ